MSYKKLYAWKESFELTKNVYRLTEQFPPSVKFGVSSQMRRSSLSIPCNLAEGSRRKTKKDFQHFCSIAFGSASELEVQIQYAKELGSAPIDAFPSIERSLDRTLRLLNGLYRSIYTTDNKLQTTDH